MLAPRAPRTVPWPFPAGRLASRSNALRTHCFTLPMKFLTPNIADTKCCTRMLARIYFSITMTLGLTIYTQESTLCASWEIRPRGLLWHSLLVSIAVANLTPNSNDVVTMIIHIHTVEPPKSTSRERAPFKSHFIQTGNYQGAAAASSMRPCLV